MSSFRSPCAACKLLRRKCTHDCVFSPYFPPDKPGKFATVHHVFGASNVAKLLNELPQNQREGAVNSLVYEAEARLQNPVYGCVGLITTLQAQIMQKHVQIDNAKKELASYMGAAAYNSFLPPYVSRSRYDMYDMFRQSGGYNHQPQQQQYDARQIMAAAAAREQEIMLARMNEGAAANINVPMAGPRQFDEGFNVQSQNEVQQQIRTQMHHLQQNHNGQHQWARSDKGGSA